LAGGHPNGLTSVINWRAVLLGFAVAASLAATLGAIGATLSLAGHLGMAAALEFVAMFVGGYVAGRNAGHLGVIQGVAVAVIFILVAASLKAWVEIDLATKFGPHVLGPMDMGGLILGDLVHLTGGCAGGWLADSERARKARPGSAAGS
jgi:hypothetical protein